MILLDTHVWLWLNGAAERLSSEVLDLVSSPAANVYLSAASAWEIGIKVSTGKLTLPAAPTDYIPLRMADNGVKPLPIRHRHALQAAALPLFHKDPFDRLLIAQAQLEKLKLVTVDRRFADYDVEILWADK